MTIATECTRPVLRYHGGKWKLAPWIIQHFPPHVVYTEVFGGAGSVLLRKAAAAIEVYNDLDQRIVRLFRVLRDPVQSALLMSRLELTPYARSEHDLSYEPTDDAVEEARRTIVRSMFGHGSRGATSAHRTGFRRARRRDFSPSTDWLNYPPALRYVVARLRGVIIECDDAMAVVERYDAPDALHYVDPPYVHSTRTDQSRKAYQHEMDDEAHRDLAGRLRSLRGMVVLSGYPSNLYGPLRADGWDCVTTKARTDARATRTEVLWINRACVNALTRNRRSA